MRGHCFSFRCVAALVNSYAGDDGPIYLSYDMIVADIRKSSSIEYIPGLDGLRALAIISVIVFHFTASYAHELAQLGPLWAIWAKVCHVGWIGVDLFFVLSGFLITRILAAKPIGTFDQYASFITRRFWRLVPAYVSCLVSVIFVALYFVPESKVIGNQKYLWTLTSNIVASFGDRNAVSDTYFSLVHFWSLALEWHFYLIFPVLIVITKSPVRTALLLVLAAIVCRIIFFLAGLSDNATYSFTFCRIDALGIGALLAMWGGKIPSGLRNRIAMLGAFCFAAILALLVSSGWQFKTLPWLQTWGYTAISASIAMMLLEIVYSSQNTKVLRFLEHSFLRNIGLSSYSLYIWHLAFFPAIAGMVNRKIENLPLSYILTFVISGSLTFLLGFASYRWVESRFVRQRVGSTTAIA